ncbi:MAG: hypothetical protein FWF04_06110 [Clostridiales bacterium]|nr:hypothetical protein [Clostridiales bacterium]
MVLGLFLYALGIVLTINANIGYGPWEVFHVGLAHKTGLSIGVASIVAGIVIAIVVTLAKEKFGLGTITSMVLTGLFIDLIIYINVIPIPQHTILGILMLVIGLFIIAVGSYFYMSSAFGAGPRDNLMVVLKRKTKLPIGVCRGMVDLTVTFIGWLLGGMVGIGTIISGCGIGFCVQIVFAIFKFDAAAVQHETLKQTFKQGGI